VYWVSEAGCTFFVKPIYIVTGIIGVAKMNNELIANHPIIVHVVPFVGVALWMMISVCLKNMGTLPSIRDAFSLCGSNYVKA
jgi:hypothetical protein